MAPNLLAIDPGNCTGWAWFSHTILQAAGTTSADASICMAYEIIRKVPGGSLIIEMPQVYRAAQSKGDPNDLIKVAVGVGRWLERARAYGLETATALPSEWKGQVPKQIHHARSLALLTAEERACLPAVRASKENPHGYDNNMMDAVSLGLWQLKRARR